MEKEIMFVVILIILQIGIMAVSIRKRRKLYNLQLHANMLLLIGIFALCLLKVFVFDWRVMPLVIVIILQAILNTIAMLKKQAPSSFSFKKFIILRIFRIFGFVILSLPFVILPFFTPIKQTGNLKVETTTVTWKNTKQTQLFVRTNSKQRSKYMTVQFWYPKQSNNTNKKYPFVLFCHVFSMLRDSNLTLMKELASHGYIVGSIDLDYDTLWSVHENHTITFQRLAEILDVQKYGYFGKNSEQWNSIRENDINNAIYYMLSLTSKEDVNAIFHKMDTSNMAMVGHSFGGSAAISVGRSNPKIKAVIALDGTAFHEGYKNPMIQDDFKVPYPVPILMMFSQMHYEWLPNMEKITGTKDQDTVLLDHAKDGYTAVIKGSDHFSFSDMHISSPLAAYFSGGTQTRNSRVVIKDINRLILQFLDKNLKNETIHIDRKVIS